MRGDARVAEAQAALVAALAGEGASLPGFDDARLRAMSALLRAKRRRGVARRWPAVAHALGERFVSSFDQYAGVTRLRSSDGQIDDTVRFLDWLRARGDLPRELWFLAVKLRLRRVVRLLTPWR